MGTSFSIFLNAVVGRKAPDSGTPINEIVDTLQSWAPTDEKELDALLELSKRSLDEVTRLTEYEDGKANRIVTAMAFLSALEGVLFAKFLDKYHMILLNDLWASSGLLICVPVLFFIYILCLILGIILIVYAVRPRFIVPAAWEQGAGDPASFLFFRQIIQIKPGAWAKAFSGKNVDILKREYIKNSILETYLIAEKIREKLVYLEP